MTESSSLAGIGTSRRSFLPFTKSFRRGEYRLLTESQVQRSFRNLFSNADMNEDTFEKAEELLDHLRPESPLRHRLFSELDELRKLCESADA